MTDTVETPADGPGSALKAAREALSVSEREVADALNLPLNVVEAMEANDYENLPPAVFTRGYLRSYAKLLELDPEAIIARFPESAQPEVTLTAEMVAVDPTRQWLRKQPVWLRGAAIGVVSILAITLAVWLWPDADEAPDVVPVNAEAVIAPADVESATEPVPNEPSGSAVSAQAADVSGTVVDEAQGSAVQLAEVAEQPVTPRQTEAMESVGREISSPPESRDDSSTQADQSPGLTAAGNTPVPSEPPQSDTSVAAAEDVASAPTPPGMRRISPFGDDVLSISFVQDCWVDVKDRDGNRLYGDLNRAGTTIQLIGRAPFRVLLGYAPGAQMTFNDDVIELTRYTRNNVASLTVGR